MLITNKSSLFFEPGRCDAVALDAAGDSYVTPSTHQPTLGYLALSRIIAGKCKGVLRLSGASAAGAATVEVRAGAAGTVIGSQVIDLMSGTKMDFAFDLDLSSLDYGTKMVLALKVTTAASASVTGQLDAVMEIEVPLVDC